MELQNLMTVVEQACGALQVTDAGTRSSAEATLLAFRRSPCPFQACQYILDHSRNATAKFIAASTIQEAAIREWTLIAADEKLRLRSYCLQYVVSKVDTSEGYILVKILSVAAALVKRGWLEFSPAEKSSFLGEVEQAVSGRHGLTAQRFGLSFLDALLSEFSLSTASAMGLPAEFHDKCRASFEAGYLQKFYAWALDASVMVANKALEGQGDNLEAAICTTAIRLMTQILNWEFRSKDGGRAIRGTLSASLGSLTRKSSDQLWYDLLVSPARVTWILNLYGHIHQKGNAWLDLPLSVVIRQLIVLLCSLNVTNFPAGGAATTHQQHLQRMFDCILSWIDPPDCVISSVLSGASESEMMDGCRALLAIATICSLSCFDQLSRTSRQVGTLNLLSSLTCGIIKASCIPQSEDSHWADEALDVLLDTWTVILQPPDPRQKLTLPPGGEEAIFSVFRAYVECQLKAALEEDDTGDMTTFANNDSDDSLSAIALVARAVPSISLPFLTMVISNCFSELRQCARKESIPGYLEQLHWLTVLTGHVVADSADGETPKVPQSLLALSAEHSTHSAVSLSCTLIEVARQSLDASFRETLLSPRVMEAIVWFLGRWADTYLMLKSYNSTPSGQGNVSFDGSSALDAAFGTDGGGPAVLEVLVRVALTSLTAWPGERVLQENVSCRLLPALVRKQTVCAQLLQLAAWQELATVFAHQDQMLLSLPNSVQRGLSGCLCRSAQGMQSAEETNKYVKDLLMPMATSLAEFSMRKDLATFAQQPHVIQQVCSVLERLRGAARDAQPRTHKAIFEIGVSTMEPLLMFMKVYKNQASVVYLILKYVAIWVDTQTTYLEPKDATMVFNFCVQLLSVYSSHNIGKVSISASRTLQNELQSERCKDLRALLQLLANLSLKDLFDLAEHAEEKPDVAQVVYLGLNIITPLISVDLLKFPKLCGQYFTLLMHMLEVYPEKVAQISPEGFNQIVGTLEFGLRHQDVEIVTMTFSALAALANFHFHSLHKGESGIGMQGRTPDGDDVLSYFLKLVMRILLFEEYSNDLVEPAADALLPLILCNAALFEKLKQELVQRLEDPESQRRISTAFSTLVNTIEITSTIDRSSRRKFRSNVSVFLNDLRGLLRTR